MKPSSGGGFVGRYFIIKTMNKKVKIVQWDEQGMKQFKSFLKQMYGEYGNISISCDGKIKS